MVQFTASLGLQGGEIFVVGFCAFGSLWLKFLEPKSGTSLCREQHGLCGKTHADLCPIPGFPLPGARQLSVTESGSSGINS